jgi:hypothetical protein
MLSEDQDGHWIDRLEEANAKKKKARKGQQGSKRSSASRQARLGTARTTRIVLGVGDDPHAGRHEKACPWSRWPDPVAVSPETAPARERGRGVKKKKVKSTLHPPTCSKVQISTSNFKTGQLWSSNSRKSSTFILLGGFCV